MRAFLLQLANELTSPEDDVDYIWFKINKFICSYRAFFSKGGIDGGRRAVVSAATPWQIHNRPYELNGTGISF